MPASVVSGVTVLVPVPSAALTVIAGDAPSVTSPAAATEFSAPVHVTVLSVAGAVAVAPRFAPPVVSPYVMTSVCATARVMLLNVTVHGPVPAIVMFPAGTATALAVAVM